MMEINLSTIAKHFQDEGEAWKALESMVWPNGPVCPHCGVINHAYFLKPKNGIRMTRTGKPSYRRLWKCADCKKQFSVLKGTIFEDTHIPLSKWLLAYHLACAGKNGVSAHEIHRELDVTYEAAWFMMHRIRHTFAPTTHKRQLTGTVEADETYIGGVKHGEGSGPQGSGKVPVVTLVERDGEARSQVMKTVTGKNVRKVLGEHIDTASTLMTDESGVYSLGHFMFAEHQTVNHAEHEYARGAAHVNTAEGFFSQLKRSLDGTYHHVSERHLPRYLGEFDYRYSNRKIKDGERTVKAIKKNVGKRLQYRDTAAKPPSVAGN
jgi:transposase-like protein